MRGLEPCFVSYSFHINILVINLLIFLYLFSFGILMKNILV